MRYKPYTSIGIRRVPCIRCGAKAEEQWNICALDRGTFKPICHQCGDELNKLVLEFLRIPDYEAKLKAYISRRNR
jgi:NAD-dependent SIR2 family protein deacetylase